MNYKERINKDKITSFSVDKLHRFIKREKGKAYYEDTDGNLFLCSTYLDDDDNIKISAGGFDLTEEEVYERVVGFVDKGADFQPEKIVVNGHTYLTLPDETLIAMLFVGEVPIYWITRDNVIKVDDARTISGGCPHCFGIRID